MGADHNIFGFRHGIAVAQVTLFAASLASGVYLFGHKRLGTPRRNGWFCIAVFSVFRLVGAGCMLGTLANDDDNVWAGVFVCESFGMVLIAFLLLELMHRANNAVPTIDPRAFYVPQLLTWADLGLAIAGFASAARREHPLAPTSLTRASFGLYTALYLWIGGMACLLSFGRRPSNEGFFPATSDAPSAAPSSASPSRRPHRLLARVPDHGRHGLERGQGAADAVPGHDVPARAGHHLRLRVHHHEDRAAAAAEGGKDGEAK
ncbi:hypothetical protein PG994_009038 [Apiospora phragmitis]|uniref:DUF7702 domain-containing protein n=1 Tax=Apiospora phragmitis TaxID=2905665 RepID=A0ABR1UI57_9PEZI